MNSAFKKRMIQHWRGWPGHILKLFLSLALVTIALYNADLHAVWLAVLSTHWASLLSATLVVLLGVVILQAYEIQRSFPTHLRPRLLRLVHINLAMMFYAFFLPTALTFTIRWSKYRQLGVNGWQSAALVGVHKILQLTVALGFAVVCYMIMPVAVPGMSVLMVGLAAGLLVLVGYFGWLCSGRELAPELRCPAYPKNAAVASALNVFLRQAQKMLTVLLDFRYLSAKDKLYCFMFALLQHICIVMSAYIVLVSIDPDAPWLSVIMIRSLLVVLLVVPVSVAGVGTRELVFFLLFPFYGVSAEDALASSLILLGIQLAIAMLGALGELVKFKGAPCVER